MILIGNFHEYASFCGEISANFLNFHSFQEIFRQSRKENVIVSPLSVKVLLTILAEAAEQNVESTTRKELRNVLPYRKTLNDTRKYFSKVLDSLNVSFLALKVLSF